MSVEDARYTYLFAAANAVFTCNASRRYREQRWLIVDGASIAYDLAVAQHFSIRAPAPVDSPRQRDDGANHLKGGALRCNGSGKAGAGDPCRGRGCGPLQPASRFPARATRSAPSLDHLTRLKGKNLSDNTESSTASMPKLFMVFDVESIGLHGEGFAVGYVVVARDGTPHGEGRYACSPARAAGNEDGRAWVKENVPELSYDFQTPRAMRTRFMIDWWFWKHQGAVLVADCGWPVEARFLAACVDDDPETRSWEGPYPLHDLASISLAAGLDPLGSTARHNDELPEHDPLADARQSSRLLLTALWILDASRPPAEMPGRGL